MFDEARLEARILVVDDEQANVDLLEMSLARAGYRDVRAITDPRTVLDLLSEGLPDLVLLDLLMPYLDGFAVLKQLRAHVADDEFLPVLVLTADVTHATRLRALNGGASDFLTKPFDQLELLLRIKNLLETRLLSQQARRQYQLMERLYHEAEATARRREEVQLALSHDLGQPAAALRLASGLLRRQASTDGIAASPALIERLNLVEAATNRMLAMTGELMDLARLQRGQELDLRYSRTDLVTLVRGEVEALAAGGAHPQLRFEPGTARLEADVDAARLARVVANLVGNAVNYSPGGGQIRVTLTEAGDGEQRQAVLVVEDHGLGIPAAELDRIGRQFFRAGNVAGRLPGTGVGMLSARRIVEAHGGSLSLESTEGEGTTVTVRLPIQ